MAPPDTPIADDNLEKLPASHDTLCGGSSTPIQSGGEKQQERDVEAISDRQSARSCHSYQSTVAESPDHDVENPDDVLRRTITPKNPIVKVPRSQRRGLFARFALPAEVTQPMDYNNRTKWFITFVVAIAGAAAPVGSAIILRMCAVLPLDVPS